MGHGPRALASDPVKVVDVKIDVQTRCTLKRRISNATDLPGPGRICADLPGAGRGSRPWDQEPGGSYLVPARRRPWDRGPGISDLGSRISDQAPAARRPAAGRGSATGDRGPGARARGPRTAIAFAYRRGPWPARFTGRWRHLLISSNLEGAQSRWRHFKSRPLTLLSPIFEQKRLALPGRFALPGPGSDQVDLTRWI
jgi:hypothetical protein